MNEELIRSLQAAVEKMTEVATTLERRNSEMSQRIERIAAEVEPLVTNSPTPPAPQPQPAPSQPATRKTLPPLVTALLAKNGVDVDNTIEASALDAALISLPVEQRIAVKSQMAKAGMIA
jgi:hypothetical protein